MRDELETRAHRLEEVLRGLGPLVVAYSGGVDSAFLASAAHRVLGPHALAVTADSPSLPRQALADVVRVARDAGFPHRIVRTGEIEREAYTRNAPDRCFHCKEALFDEVFPLAESLGFAYVAIGTVTDDLDDVRPGLVSARRRGARQPLVDAGLSKDDVRRLARDAGLGVWDKPADACLSSRVPHGTPITVDVLRRVETAEQAVRSLGFRIVRVRHHGDAARVEVGAGELARLADELVRRKVLAAVAATGYRDVVIDEGGYRRGGAGLPIVTS